MHPLDTIIDESHHSPRHIARRRSSLDNSCLAAPDTFRQIMRDDDSFHHSSGYDSRGGRNAAAQRRLSWNSAVSKPTTFLAGPMTPSSRPKKVELDADFHNSHHSPKGGCLSSSHDATGATKSRTVLLTDSPPAVSDDGDISEDDDRSEGSLDSDCDSFCDASFQEPANREYLRRDLGASCYWGSTDTCMLGDLDDEDFDEVESAVNDMIRNEGLESLDLND